MRQIINEEDISIVTSNMKTPTNLLNNIISYIKIISSRYVYEKSTFRVTV